MTTHREHTVGFLGLGNMGQAIAGRLVAAGYDVVVWNRSPEAADELVAAGARRASDARDALAAQVSFSMLADDAAAEAVLSETNLAGGAEGRIHVNMASISAAAADRIQAVAESAGVGYVSCPVLGRPNVAAEGKLNLLVAGAPALCEAVAPYLEHCGVRQWRFGDTPRQANAVKVAMNFTILHALQAMAESITLVEAHDVNASDFIDLMSNSLFGGAVYAGYGSMIAERRYSPPGFRMPLGLKDLGLAEDLAAEKSVELPTAPTLRDRFERALADRELADLDWSAVAEVTRRR
ncbi:3-hydroxyisobutyrate dehydrogenase-like beta-hydroxyacid dehydrogenase [Microcella alkaliphila]|uniref:3-hydroxyisobutyrate dehydrogenase-like beta-hydroxyacid dehydrogenase n=2 Tax=Microcella alkaliphila TaxID=279828 RepID=A0A4Q7TEI6_9MICO|nr:3-hydroxyisobutyrate dehydrogenase-like beta-hydroxyacid dehydrogenase [Microcella alkaliphila]